MRNRIGNRGANRERWQERVRQANQHPEGLSAYCRANDISIGALNYWRKKEQSKSPALAQRSAFVPIQVMAAETEVPAPRLPDSKWVADLILHLSAGVSRSGR